MGAFDKGFSFGLGAWQQAMDNKRQDDKDERAKKEFGWKEEDRKRVAADREREDSAWTALGPTAGVAAPLVAANAPAEAAEPTGSSSVGASEPNPALLRATQPAQQGVSAAFSTPPASRAGQLRALEGIAIARRDAGSLERIGAARQSAEEDDFFGQAMKGYTGAEDQIGATAMHINSTSKSITMGAPDKNGVVQLAVVTPDRRAQFLTLSRDQQARLYAAGQLMERNPARALREISDVNKPLAEALAAEGGLVTKVAGSNNQAAFNTRDDERADRQQAEAARHNRATEVLSAARASEKGATKYDFDPIKVQRAFGETSTDPLTGKDTVKRNPAEERKFHEFMADNPNIRDVDEGLVRYNRARVQRDRETSDAVRTKVSGAMSQENLVATAKKHGMSVEEVVQELMNRGITPVVQETPSPAPAVTSAPSASPSAPAVARSSPTPAPPQGGDPAEDAPAGRALDAAKMGLRDAIAKARTFGLAQRAADPTAYQAAMNRVRAAEAAAAQAEKQWQNAIAQQGVTAYFGGAR